MLIDPNFFIHVAQAAETAAEEAHNSGIAGTLGLNAKLFIAQLVNFGIVLFVLWKWVFTPVTKALTARTEKIEKSLQTAENTEQERAKFEEWKKEELGKTRKEAGEIIAEAKSQSKALQDSMLIETRHSQEAVIEKTRKQLLDEQAQAITTIKAEMADLIVSATQTVIGVKLDPTKDKELIKSALEKAK